MDNQFRFLIYKTETEDVSVDALIRGDTIWLTQKAMAELFAIDKSGISRHLKNIFESGELEEQVVVAKVAIPTKHGAIPEKEVFSNNIRRRPSSSVYRPTFEIMADLRRLEADISGGLAELEGML